jgi:hypothetical protein
MMNQTIEALRQKVKNAPKERRLTPTEVTGVVNGLVACHSLADVASDTGLDEADVLDVVAAFGTWLTHVNGGSGAVTRNAASVDQQPLFQSPAPAKVSAKAKKAAAKKAPAKKAPAKKAASKRAKSSGPPVVIVPPGFERTAPHGRDVAKALAAVVVADPDEAVVTRFIARRYASTAKVLTFPLVASVWRFAVSGRLDEIDQINPDNLVFAELQVAAYDTLEVARLDCHAGIRTLCAADVSDLQVLSDAAARCRWVAEGEVSKLEKLIEVAEKSETARPLLAKELRFFAQAVQAAPDRYLPGSIADLNEAHVLRIGQAAGLAVDGGSRSDEADIRRRLQDLGLGSDVDRLVPEGIRAASVDLGDVFWDAMERRASGDPSWDDDLLDAFESATLATSG